MTRTTLKVSVPSLLTASSRGELPTPPHPQGRFALIPFSRRPDHLSHPNPPRGSMDGILRKICTLSVASTSPSSLEATHL